MISSTLPAVRHGCGGHRHRPSLRNERLIGERRTLGDLATNTIAGTMRRRRIQTGQAGMLFGDKGPRAQAPDPRSGPCVPTPTRLLVAGHTYSTAPGISSPM